MRVLLQCVARNEASRYWASWLDWHVSVFGAENMHVYDDRSTDSTAEMADKYAIATTVRDDDAPSFLEHEGRLRQRAWKAMEEVLEPEPGDWVFAIDADEFLLARADEDRELYRNCEWANAQGHGAFTVTIPEIFRTDLEDDGKLTGLQVRVDGWWGRIAGTRLFAWRPGGVFADKAMGSGSEPGYVAQVQRSALQGMWLLHYGYARPEDAQAKFARYTARPEGHANDHVRSIVEPPQLASWDGPLIDVYLGSRPAPGPDL
jgi:hypothetical protein